MPEIVQEIGAYAGLASVLGLAVLSALYFSQARDVKRLREWAGRAPERAPGQPVPQQRVVAQPQRPGQPQAAPGAQAAAVRPGAPPVPGQQRPGVPTVPVAAKAAAAAAGARPAAATSAAPQGGAPNAPPGAQAPAAPAQGQGAPVQAATGAASAPTQVVPPQAATPAGGRPAGGGPVVPAGRNPTATTQLPTRSAPPTTAAPKAPEPGPWYRTPRYVVLAVVGVLVIGGGAAFGLTQLGGGDTGGSSSRSAQQANGGSEDSGQDNGGRSQPAIDPASVTVAVLNGTTVPGLARQVSDELQQRGFRVGNVDNSPDSDQQRAESVVQFASGHRREAMAVGRRLKIGQREPIDPSVQQLAGDATVVVITGQDQSATP